MRYLITIILALLLTPVAADARMNVGVLGGGVTAAGCTLSALQSTYEDDWETATRASANTYMGQTGFTVASNISVCKIGFYIHSVIGTITGNTYVVDVWNITASTPDLPATAACTSNTVAGTGISNGNWTDFTFASPCALATGNTYAITIAHSNYSYNHDTDYFEVYITSFATHGSQLAGSNMLWNSSKEAQTGNSGFDTDIRIYTQ